MGKVTEWRARYFGGWELEKVERGEYDQYLHPFMAPTSVTD